jgi:hypothetical protein
VVEAGWSPPPHTAPQVKIRLDGQEQEATMNTILQFGQRCVAALRLHEDSAAFIVPVNPDEVPDYYHVIKVYIS